MKRIAIALIAVIVVWLGSIVGASAATLPSSKSLSQIVGLSDADLMKLINAQDGQCLPLTYGGSTQVADLCPAGATPSGSATPSPTPTKTTASPTPTPTPTTASPTPTKTTAAPTNASAPSSLLDLSRWYLGIPVNTSHDGAPDIIRQPELTGYTNQWFHLNSAKTGVVFTTRADGYTTSNSSYPRTELREMADSGGENQASWDSSKGTNVLSVSESIDAVTPVKPEVVAAQIHDASDDVIEVELSGSRLYVKYANDSQTTTIDANYKLGTRYSLKLSATSAGIGVYYNGALVTTIKQTGSGWYYKTGDYQQSSVAKGESPSASSQVTIYGLSVSHT
jgi:hypothetical protein